MQAGDTFPRLLLGHASARGDKPAMREKDLGIWQTWTWSNVAEQAMQVAAGLASLGLQRGAHVAIIGDNRPSLYAAMMAVQALGAIPVPLYQDAVANEMAYVFQDAEISFAIVEDQEQVDKVLELKKQCPLIAHILYDDPRGLRHYTQGELKSLEQVLAAGKTFSAAQPGYVKAEIDKGRPDETAAMFYTSGTTGNPKGVVHTHNNLIDRARVAVAFDNLSADDDILAYLPPAWIGQNIFSYSMMLVSGFCVSCPESAATVTTDLKEIGPTYYFAPPRVFEGLLTQVSIRMEDASALKRNMFNYFMGVAKKVGVPLLEGKSVSFIDRMLYGLGNVFVYGPLKNNLGFSRVKCAYTAGEAIGPDLFDFYRSLGINLKQLYGSTETAVFVCMQPNGQVKSDTVGTPVEGVEIKFTEGGELLVKSPGLLREYYKNPTATAEVKTTDGFYRTGDAGFLDADGHLKIIDRAKDVGAMADGTLFAPKYIENKLKFFPYIKEAVVFGNQRDMACAFINIDMQAVGNWAERKGLIYTGYVDLGSKDEVVKLIGECVEKVNADLAADAKLANSQIHRYLVLHKELDADDGELTRTSKVRRGFIGEKYQVLVDAFYSGKTVEHIETQVKFEDGRTGVVSADLRIAPAKTFSAAAALKAA